MKLKYPKTVRGGTFAFKVKYEKKNDEGSFQYYPQPVIKIGIKSGSVPRTLEIIIHELKELIQVEQFVRFSDPSATDSFQFVYSHKEHADFCSRLAGLLEEFIV